MMQNPINAKHLPSAGGPPAGHAVYPALHEGAAVLARPAGLLQLHDVDRVDFLQRMTTNDIKALRPGQSCVTVLTSPTARIVHVFTVLARTHDLLLLPAPSERAGLLRHLRSQIFFMDKVQVTDLSAEYQRARIVGAQRAALLAALGFSPSAAEGSWQEADGLLALFQEEYDLPGAELLLPAAKAEAALAQLAAAGALLLQEEDYAVAYLARRVELGRPAPGAELTEDVNPLEAGLGWTCAENKGCYTGQEIIARQLTYDKVTRALVGLQSEQLLAAGMPLLIDGREAGRVTSAVFSPRLGMPLALAIVKRPHNAPGSVLAAGAEQVPATVCELPFR